MRKVLVSLFVVFGLALAAQAQEFDAAFGFGTVTSKASSFDSSGNFFPSLSGGLYPSFSGIVLLKHHLGVGGEVAWRAHQNFTPTSFGFIQPYRPIFYDFNAVYGRTYKKFGADVMAGIGGEDLRFYGVINCNGGGCTNYVSSNHFAGHFGADVRIYVWGHLFVRPEAHYYVIHNNQEFNNANAARFAVSIGYSFTPGF